MQGPVLEDLYEGQDGVAALPATGQINPGRQCVTPMTPHKPWKDGSVGSRTRSWSASGWVRLSAGGAVTGPATRMRRLEQRFLTPCAGIAGMARLAPRGRGMDAPGPRPRSGLSQESSE